MTLCLSTNCAQPCATAYVLIGANRCKLSATIWLYSFSGSDKGGSDVEEEGTDDGDIGESKGLYVEKTRSIYVYSTSEGAGICLDRWRGVTTKQSYACSDLNTRELASQASFYTTRDRHLLVSKKVLPNKMFWFCLFTQLQYDCVFEKIHFLNWFWCYCAAIVDWAQHKRGRFRHQNSKPGAVWWGVGGYLVDEKQTSLEHGLLERFED